MLRKITQTIPGNGGTRSVSRTAAAGTPGSVELAVGTDTGLVATVTFTLTANGQLWVNTRGRTSAVVLVATLDPVTGEWEHDVDAKAL